MNMNIIFLLTVLLICLNSNFAKFVEETKSNKSLRGAKSVEVDKSLKSNKNRLPAHNKPIITLQTHDKSLKSNKYRLPADNKPIKTLQTHDKSSNSNQAKWKHRETWNHFKSYSKSDVKPKPYGDGVTKKFPIDDYLDPTQKKYMKYREGPDRQEAMSTRENP